MRTSSKRLAALALSMLFTLAAIESRAQAAPEVKSTVHYQHEVFLVCNGASCAADFPPVAAKRRLLLTRMSCFFSNVSGEAYAQGFVNLLRANNSHVLYQHLPVGSSSPNGAHVVNTAIDLLVRAGHHIRVSLSAEGGISQSGQCTATGTMEILE
jgi:hypothetical protein